MLLAWPSLLLPTASALCGLLRGLLEDATLDGALQPAERAQLYGVVRRALDVLGAPAAEQLAAPALKCAWAEFQVRRGGGGAGIVSVAHKQSKKSRKGAKDADITETQERAAVRVAEHEQRPAMLERRTDAQARVPPTPDSHDAYRRTQCAAQG